MKPASRALAAAALFALGCGSKSGGDASASGSSIPLPKTTSAAPAGPAPPKAMCDTVTPDEHVCFELDDAELVAERESTCQGKFVKDQACPRQNVLGVCRLPEGSLRYGYPPKTVSFHEKTCKEVQGKWAAGTEPPIDEPATLVSCDGKYENVCEEEDVHTSVRLPAAQEECRNFGGKFRTGIGCSRDGARFICDLRGKKTLVSRTVTTPDAAKRFCTERVGVYREVLASTAPEPGTSSSAVVDTDPPEPKPDVVIRQQ